MTELRKLPIEIEDFYYVDKTRLIEQLLIQWAEVNVFTRPRRFGKSLNMSMFQHFFEIGSKKRLFDGLEISNNLKLCEEYQGKYPVVSISLKGINGITYEEARGFLIKTINEEARRLSFLSESQKLDETDQELLNQLKKKEMSNDSLVYSIRELTELLEKHYEKCPYPDNWIIRKHARVRAKESRGTRGELVDTWLSRAIEQEAPTSKSKI